jgi:hypothetical protein
LGVFKFHGVWDKFALVEGSAYTAAQANVSTIAQARTAVSTVINALSLNGVTPTIIDGTFTPAIAGTVGNLNGTDGSFTFTVNINKGAGTQQTTNTLTLTITATPYDVTSDKSEVPTSELQAR